MPHFNNRSRPRSSATVAGISHSGRVPGAPPSLSCGRGRRARLPPSVGLGVVLFFFFFSCGFFSVFFSRFWRRFVRAAFFFSLLCSRWSPCCSSAWLLVSRSCSWPWPRSPVLLRCSRFAVVPVSSPGVLCLVFGAVCGSVCLVAVCSFVASLRFRSFVVRGRRACLVARCSLACLLRRPFGGGGSWLRCVAVCLPGRSCRAFLWSGVLFLPGVLFACVCAVCGGSCPGAFVSFRLWWWSWFLSWCFLPVVLLLAVRGFGSFLFPAGRFLFCFSCLCGAALPPALVGFAHQGDVLHTSYFDEKRISITGIKLVYYRLISTT